MNRNVLEKVGLTGEKKGKVNAYFNSFCLLLLREYNYVGKKLRLSNRTILHSLSFNSYAYWRKKKKRKKRNH